MTIAGGNVPEHKWNFGRMFTEQGRQLDHKSSKEQNDWKRLLHGCNGLVRYGFTLALQFGFYVCEQFNHKRVG
jgi:hypothetical protein